MYSYCRIIGCSGTPTAAEGKGLDRLYCRKHADHFERHGSYHQPSYTAAQLASHRKSAKAWLKENFESREVQLAIHAVQRRMREVPHVEAFRLRGKLPEERAKIAWARLLAAKVHPLRVLEAALGIELAIDADPQAERKKEFKRVQMAKVVHRMASGSHKRWERELPGGRVIPQELHKYPHSRGQVLRHLGKQIGDAVDVLIAPCLFELTRRSASHSR
jgi:hypothetical protein